MIPSCTALNIFHPKTPLPHRRVEREGVTPQEWIVMLRIGYRMPLGLTMRPADTILSDLHRMTQLRPLTCYLFSWQQPREGSLLTRPERPEKKNPYGWVPSRGGIECHRTQHNRNPCVGVRFVTFTIPLVTRLFHRLAKLKATLKPCQAHSLIRQSIIFPTTENSPLAL